MLDVHREGPGLPALAPQRADVLDDLRVHRELHPAVLARRGGARQAVAARQDARRRVAEVRQPARAVRLHVRRTRARSCCSWAASSASGASGTTTPSLDWHLLDGPEHAGLQHVGARPQRAVPRRAGAARASISTDGFQWIDCTTTRTASCRFAQGEGSATTSSWSCPTSRPCREHVRGRRARGGFYREILNTDAGMYGGSGVGNLGGLDAVRQASHGYDQRLPLTVPPLGAVVLTPVRANAVAAVTRDE